MRELSLFSGGGGSALTGKLLGWRTVGYVENNEYCQKEIRQRIEDQVFDNAPIFGDIRTFNSSGFAESYSGMVDVLTAGFPCQPFSLAGKRKGKNDDRNMWPETKETIRKVRPTFAFLENVPGIISSGYLDRICGDLVEIGYDHRWCVLSAAAVGAPHKRERLWIVAYRINEGLEGHAGDGPGIIRQVWEVSESSRSISTDGLRSGEGIMVYSKEHGWDPWWKDNATKRKERGEFNRGCFKKDVSYNQCKHDNHSGYGTSKICRERPEEADIPRSQDDPNPHSKRKLQQKGVIKNIGRWAGDFRQEILKFEWWESEPGMGRVVNGVANRAHRLRALGNGWVPAVAATAWYILTEDLL
jgi:DNA (cytosine-5)-methyltransferase 1